MAKGDRIRFRNKTRTDALINQNIHDIDVLEQFMHDQEAAMSETAEFNEILIKGKRVATENYVNELIAAAGTGDNNVDITRTYNFTGDGETTTFKFPFIGESVSVFIEGIKVPASDYTLNKNAETGDGESVTLKNAPEKGDKISFIAYGGADVYNKVQAEALFLKKSDAQEKYLAKDNTIEYSPSAPYEPATKAYVDAMASSGGGNVEITKIYRHVAKADQTEFSATYILGSLSVFLNGTELDSTDYDAPDGKKVVLKKGAKENDIIRIIAYGGADVYNKTQMDALLNTKADVSSALIHLEQDDEPNLNDVKPGDTWWDTNDNKLYKCVTVNGDKTWLQIA